MPLDIGIKDLKLVRLIAEAGSLTSAARRMHVSQPAASQRLANLQDRLGTAIFERVDGQMRPTTIGKRLVATANRVTEELERACADIRKHADDRADRLRVTTQCYTCYRWLPFVISEMRSLYPDLTLDVLPEATDAPYDALKSDRIDIAIVSSPDEASPFEHHALFGDELYAVMNSSDPLASRKFLTLKDLSTRTLLLYTGNRHAILDELLHPAGVSPARVIQVRITEAIVELARSGQGIAVLSGWAFSDLDNNDGLSAIRITRAGFKRTWVAAVGSNCNEEYVAAFVRCVRNVGESIRDQNWRMNLQSQSMSAAGQPIRKHARKTSK